MDYIPKNDILRYHSNTLQAVRELHNLDKPGEMKAAIDRLEEWIQKQTHFVKKDFSRHRLEMMLLGAKGSIEKTKQRLDKLCTYRTALGEYFGDFDIRKDFEELNSFTFRAAPPTLTENHLRVCMLIATGSKIGVNFVSDMIKMSIMGVALVGEAIAIPDLLKRHIVVMSNQEVKKIYGEETRMGITCWSHVLSRGQEFGGLLLYALNIYTEYFCTYDYNDGYVFILDFTELDLMAVVSKLYITEVRKGAAILLVTKNPYLLVEMLNLGDAMALRIKGLHFVTSSKVIETIIKIIKQVVNEKIRNRIYSHKTIETVYDFVPQEILPVEYGGKEKSYKILHEELLEKLSSKEFRAHQKEIMNARTDESKRSKEVFHEQYLGMPGSFRTLTVD